MSDTKEVRSASTADHATGLPGKVIVTLKAGGAFFALANVICVGIIAWAYLSVKLEPKTLQVTGSARKAIVSDLVTWSGSLTVKDPDLNAAYDKLKTQSDKVRAYLIARGIPEGQITFSAISTSRRFEQKFLIPPTVPAPATPKSDDASESAQNDADAGDSRPTSGSATVKPVLITTDKVEMYTLNQWVSVESQDTARLPEVARSITELIREGVEIDSGSCRYLYTKLAELKIDMLAEATKDATARAGQIVNNANGSLGKLVEARMGVMQINPKNVTDTSAEGNNDTTSLEKEITAIVAARFEVH